MAIEFGLTTEMVNTQYAVLGVLLAHYQQNQVLKSLDQVRISMKSGDFSPNDKVEQVLVSILAGCETISEVNLKLKPEIQLAQLCDWPRFADQSGLSRTLDALTLMNIEQLRQAVTQILHQQGQTVNHDWRGHLYLDFDLSGLPCGKKAQESHKGYFAKKNVTGRQLARVSAIKYRETLWSELYPGNQHTVHCFQPAVLAIESSLELDERQRKRTVWRMDGGAGTDEHIKWLLARGYHVIAKGLSHFRAAKLAQQAQRWDAYDDWWLAEVPPSVDYGCPIRVFVRRRLKDDKWRHSYYLSTLQLPSKGCFLDFYHRRGGAEVEQFRQDKSGLNLATRRKQSFTGQLGYILLTDLAHNLLADFHHKALVGSRFENYGLKRIVRDLLNVPGRLVVENNQLKSVELLTLMKNSKDLIICLERYISAQ